MKIKWFIWWWWWWLTSIETKLWSIGHKETNYLVWFKILFICSKSLERNLSSSPSFWQCKKLGRSVLQQIFWNWDLMWLYAKHSKRKWFSSSMFVFSQRWQNLSIHGVLRTAQRPVSLWSSWEFVLILAILIFFFELVKTKRYFLSSRVGLMTSL